MYGQTPRNLALTILTAGIALTACQKPAGPDLAPEVERLKAELEAAKKQVAVVEKTVEVKAAEAAAAAPAAAVSDEPKSLAAEKDKAIAEKDGQIRALQTELAELKKSHGIAFAEIRSVEASGLIKSALDRYQQFLADYPDSPLASDAKEAVDKLKVDVTRRDNEIDPRKREREMMVKFNQGITTVEEVAPVVKGRAAADVVRLLGAPSQTFRNGAEVGYANSVINPATGGKGMLIIKFEEGIVATLRVDYTGREIRP